MGLRDVWLCEGCWNHMLYRRLQPALVTHSQATYSMKSTLRCISKFKNFIWFTFGSQCGLLRVRAWLCVTSAAASWKCDFSMWFKPLLNPPLNPIPYPGRCPANCSKLPMTSSIISKSKKKMHVGTLLWWVISSELTPFSKIHWWFIAQENNMFMYIYNYSNVDMWSVRSIDPM